MEFPTLAGSSFSSSKADTLSGFSKRMRKRKQRT